MNKQVTITDVGAYMYSIMNDKMTMNQLKNIIMYVETIRENSNLKTDSYYFICCHETSSSRPYLTILEVNQINNPTYPYKKSIANCRYAYTCGITRDYKYETILIPEKIFNTMENFQ